MQPIFEQYLNINSLHKIEEKIQEDENFVITENNVHEFCDCTDIIKMLSENGIRSTIKLEDEISYRNYHQIPSRKFQYYHVKIVILISDEDYEKIKEYFESKNIIESSIEDSEIKFHNWPNIILDSLFYIIMTIFSIALLIYGIYYTFKVSNPAPNFLGIFLILIAVFLLYFWAKKILKLIFENHLKNN